MRVCYVSNFFPPESSAGTEVYTLGIARAMQARGHVVSAFAAGRWAEGKTYCGRPRDDMDQGVPVRRLDLNWQRAPDPFRYLYDNPVAAAHLEAYLRQVQPDVVHVMSTYTLSARVIRTAKAFGLPVIVTLHDYWFLCPRVSLIRSDGAVCDGHVPARECLRCMTRQGKAYRWPRKLMPETSVLAILGLSARIPVLARMRGLIGLVGDYEARRIALREAIHLVDRILVPSHFLAPFFVGHGFPAERIRVLEEGIDTSWYTGSVPREHADHLRIGYIGQVIPAKGVHVLVAAFQRLRGPATLTIYGHPHQNRAYFEQLASLARGNPRVAFAGRFEHPALERVMAQVDVLVVPSLWHETFCIVAREALLAGVPVIGSQMGGIPDAIQHGRNGYLFPPGDVAALAGYLQQLIDHPSLLDQLRRGIGQVRSIEEEAIEMEAEYERLTSGSRAALKGRAA